MKSTGDAPTPDSVFTTRGPVNLEMYVERREHETELGKALTLTNPPPLLLYGESGCGKTWLFTKVLKNLKAGWRLCNLSHASTLGSLTKAFEKVLSRGASAQLTGYTERKQAKLSASPFAEAELDHTKNFVEAPKDAFWTLLKDCRKQAGNGRPAILVLDNLELIAEESADPELAGTNRRVLKELVNYIVSLDEPYYAEHRVTLLIVGIPRILDDHFSLLPNSAPVKNRLRELTEVRHLSESECQELILRGFNKLSIGTDDLSWLIKTPTTPARSAIIDHITFVTDHVPLLVQDYCRRLAEMALEPAQHITPILLSNADGRWLSTTLKSAYKPVKENALRDESSSRVLYALGRIGKHDFSQSEVETQVSKEFPRSGRGPTNTTAEVLDRLAGSPKGLLKRSADSFFFRHQTTRPTIRIALKKNSNSEQVNVLPLPRK